MKTSTIVFGGFFITDNGERIQIPILENPNIKEINNFFSVSNFEKKPESLFSELFLSLNLAILN